MSAYTRLESVGAIATSIFPSGGFGSPGCSTRFHVAPASVDLYTPSPITSTSRIAQGSPVPAHTMSGLDGASASDPIAMTGWLSKIGVKVLPPSVDFQMPPDAAPA